MSVVVADNDKTKERLCKESAKKPYPRSKQTSRRTKNDSRCLYFLVGSFLVGLTTLANVCNGDLDGPGLSESISCLTMAPLSR